MYSDINGNLPQWANWLIGGAFIIGAIALTIGTVGLGGALATVMCVAQAASNYNNAYNDYIIAKGTYTFAHGLAKAGYIVSENLLSDIIGQLF